MENNFYNPMPQMPQMPQSNPEYERYAKSGLAKCIAAGVLAIPNLGFNSVEALDQEQVMVLIIVCFVCSLLSVIFASLALGSQTKAKRALGRRTGKTLGTKIASIVILVIACIFLAIEAVGVFVIFAFGAFSFL